jgi:MoaA/NifB/PqqE/SkfB family radical SAM enzyme
MRNIAGYLANTWVLANPTIGYRIARGFVRALLLGKDTLKTIEIFPTMRCNLACQMCSIGKAETADGDDLTLSDYERVAREGAALGAMSVNILGGEPLLHDRIEDIVRIFRRHGYFVLMVSNATLVTPDLLHRLREAGLHAICFSLDSMDEETNDRIRGVPGHFRKVFAAVEAARRERLIVSLAPVFFPGRMEDAKAVVRYCQEHGLGASGTQAAPVGRAEQAAVLSREEHDEIRQLIRDFSRLTLDWALSFHLETRCPAGKEKVGVTNRGDVIACSINQIAFGNVRDEPLGAIWERMGRFSQFRKNARVCLAAEDAEYIERYIRPLSRFASYPVWFSQHPAIGPDTEPALFETQAVNAKSARQGPPLR